MCVCIYTHTCPVPLSHFHFVCPPDTGQLTFVPCPCLSVLMWRSCPLLSVVLLRIFSCAHVPVFRRSIVACLFPTFGITNNRFPFLSLGALLRKHRQSRGCPYNSPEPTKNGHRSALDNLDWQSRSSKLQAIVGPFTAFSQDSCDNFAIDSLLPVDSPLFLGVFSQWLRVSNPLPPFPLPHRRPTLWGTALDRGRGGVDARVAPPRHTYGGKESLFLRRWVWGRGKFQNFWGI